VNRPSPDPAAIRRVAIVAKIGSPDGPDVARKLGRWLKDRGIEVVFEQETATALGMVDGTPRAALADCDLDLAIVAGGDGTLLSMARIAAPQGIPLLGVNLGSLGFLTELQRDELFDGLEEVFAGRYSVEQRQTLRVRLTREGHADEEHALLNDVVITKSALARMIRIELKVDDAQVAVYTSDGLIVSTPTGSTAYSLSAGGPILDPRMGAYVIAPICPHTMTYRPLVVPADVRLRIALLTDDEEAYLTLDGQIGYPLIRGDNIEVDNHPHPVRLIRVAGRDFFEVLRRKLRWGER
jgi:NAD+ kinase